MNETDRPSRVLVVGGSFDPPHRGHVELARHVAGVRAMDRILFVPVSRNPLKPRAPLAPDEHRLAMLDLVVRNARLAFDLEWKHPRQQSQEILRALRDLLDLEIEPRRIECFDISNIQGSDIVASMVVFEEGLPRKSDYRKFRVKGVTGAPDDFASMREVVGRRYRRLLEEGKELPELVLIDGGKGHLGAAVEALEELGLGDQPVASLAKREELLFVRGKALPISLPRSSPVLQLVQRVRDEAHRFAIGSHRARRKKAASANPLDDVAGIGPARKRALLQHFGSAKAVSRAGAADLQAVDGISKQMAQSIYDFFHEN